MANIFDSIRNMTDNVMRDFLSLNANFEKQFQNLGQQVPAITSASAPQTQTQKTDETGKMVEKDTTSRGAMEPFSTFGMVGGLGADLTFNIIESTPTQVKAEINLPKGIDKNDIKIDVNNDMLSISGHKEREDRDEREGMKRYSSSSCSFMRTVRLPQGAKADEVKAKWKEGKLQLCIPREEVKTAQKHINVE